MGVYVCVFVSPTLFPLVIALVIHGGNSIAPGRMYDVTRSQWVWLVVGARKRRARGETMIYLIQKMTWVRTDVAVSFISWM